jgi:thiol-disulfide isomerase/thioredoxin
MRKISILSFCLSLGAFGCSNAPHVDTTPNQMEEGQDYPAGPYGYVTGSVMQNIKFLGKNDPAGTAGKMAYSDLALSPISLADYHKDPAVKYVVLSGVAGWCGPCNDEQPSVVAAAAKYEPLGFRFFEALIQGYNAKTGAPATENDLNKWQFAHELHVGIGLDPEDKIHEYADVAAFPLNMVVRTSDMQIVFMKIGEMDIDPILANLK